MKKGTKLKTLFNIWACCGGCKNRKHIVIKKLYFYYKACYCKAGYYIAFTENGYARVKYKNNIT